MTHTDRVRFQARIAGKNAICAGTDEKEPTSALRHTRTGRIQNAPRRHKPIPSASKAPSHDLKDGNTRTTHHARDILESEIGWPKLADQAREVQSQVVARIPSEPLAHIREALTRRTSEDNRKLRGADARQTTKLLTIERRDVATDRSTKGKVDGMRGAMDGINIERGNDIEASELEAETHPTSTRKQVHRDGSHSIPQNQTVTRSGRQSTRRERRCRSRGTAKGRRRASGASRNQALDRRAVDPREHRGSHAKGARERRHRTRSSATELLGKSSADVSLIQPAPRPSHYAGRTLEGRAKIGEQRRERTLKSTRGDAASLGERTRRTGSREEDLRLKLDANILKEPCPQGLAARTQGAREIGPVALDHRETRLRLRCDSQQGEGQIAGDLALQDHAQSGAQLGQHPGALARGRLTRTPRSGDMLGVQGESLA